MTETVKLKKQTPKEEKPPRSRITWADIKRQKSLILLTIPFIVYALVFNYLPLAGWAMAFQDYKPKNGLFGSERAEMLGMANFIELFSDEIFLRVIRNTFCMGFINLITGTVCSIMLAILLNEVRNRHAKKAVQTISYLPHFLSWVIVIGIARDVLSPETGIINQLLVQLNILDAPINWLAYPKYFWGIVAGVNIWKEVGWGSIIYLSAITSINPDLYEAASIDGAGRIRKIMHVTIPGLKPTIAILLLINLGNVLNQSFEIQYLLHNDLVVRVSQTVDIYILKYGISQGDFSLGTAAGIFKSVVSIALVAIGNFVSKRLGEETLY